MKRVLLTLGLLASFAMTLHAQSEESPEITVEELRQHVGRLASDDWMGRKPGHSGCDEAAEYLRDHLRTAGVTMLGEDGFQNFDITTDMLPSPDCAARVGDAALVMDKDFRPVVFSGNATLKARVLWVGYGFDFEKDKSTWRDYEGLDVKGAWVLILRGSPDDKSGDYDPWSSLRAKALAARDKGAAGVLFVSGPVGDKDDKLVDVRWQMQDTPMDIPLLSISRGVADRLLDGATVAELEARLIAGKQPVRCATKGEVDATVRMLPKTITTRNVIGVVEGSDAALKDEYVLIGAHYDHLGMGGPGSGSRRPDTVAVHNGADDNASGTAAVMEIMERVAAYRNEFRRSVLVALFSAEEMGLVGSKEYVNNPPVDLKKITLMCNLDMVGRLDTARAISVGGTGTAKDLNIIVEAAARQHQLRATMSPEGFGPSDHAAFYSKDIPVLFYFTGVHDDYHTPFDDAELINYDGQKIVADMVFDVLRDAGGRDTRLVFQEAGPKSRPQGAARYKVTLGIMPDVSGGDGKGLRVDAVMKDRPAERAGLKKGDVIVSMEGKSVTGVYDYMARLGEFKVGQRISVEALRDGKRHVFIVEL